MANYRIIKSVLYIHVYEYKAITLGNCPRESTVIWDRDGDGATTGYALFKYFKKKNDIYYSATDQ